MKFFGGERRVEEASRPSPESLSGGRQVESIYPGEAERWQSVAAAYRDDLLNFVPYGKYGMLYEVSISPGSRDLTAFEILYRARKNGFELPYIWKTRTEEKLVAEKVLQAASRLGIPANELKDDLLARVLVYCESGSWANRLTIVDKKMRDCSVAALCKAAFDLAQDEDQAWKLFEELHRKIHSDEDTPLNLRAFLDEQHVLYQYDQSESSIESLDDQLRLANLERCFGLRGLALDYLARVKNWCFTEIFSNKELLRIWTTLANEYAELGDFEALQCSRSGVVSFLGSSEIKKWPQDEFDRSLVEIVARGGRFDLAENIVEECDAFGAVELCAILAPLAAKRHRELGDLVLPRGRSATSAYRDYRTGASLVLEQTNSRPEYWLQRLNEAAKRAALDEKLGQEEMRYLLLKRATAFAATAEHFGPTAIGREHLWRAHDFYTQYTPGSKPNEGEINYLLTEQRAAVFVEEPRLEGLDENGGITFNLYYAVSGDSRREWLVVQGELNLVADLFQRAGEERAKRGHVPRKL